MVRRADAVFEFAAPVAVKATGVMPYQTVIVETHLPGLRRGRGFRRLQ